MANRDLNFDTTVNNVVPAHDGSLDLATGLLEVGAKIADASEQSKVLASSAQAHVAFRQLDADYRTKYADDPANKNGIQELQEARKNVIDGLSSNISPFYQRQFTAKTTDLATQSDLSNELWSTHQNYKNTINNVNTTIKTYTDTANQDGRIFGASDSTDGSNIMNYLQAGSQLKEFAGKNIGADKANVLLKDFNKDYVKSFVSGVAETSPEKATQLLSDPNIVEHFTTAERGDMVDQIARVKRQQQLQKDLATTGNNSQIMDIVNDPNTTYYEKRAAIDRGELDGSFSPKVAANSRRVIKSTSDLDTQTDTPIMADIINKVYDLNAVSSTNASEYLRGVQHIQADILDKQASGKLTAPDASKLNRELTTLTSKRTSEATQSVGNEFYEANQKFQSLPPEYRGQATRELFYKADGRNFTQQDYSNAARAVIDNINQQRRGNALKVISSTTQSDNAFLKSINATAEDVTATALKHHISEAEVIRHLRAKRGQKQPVTQVNDGSASQVPANTEGNPQQQPPDQIDTGDGE